MNWRRSGAEWSVRLFESGSSSGWEERGVVGAGAGMFGVFDPDRLSQGWSGRAGVGALLDTSVERVG